MGSLGDNRLNPLSALKIKMLERLIENQDWRW
jgi:hypothetical protein